MRGSDAVAVQTSKPQEVNEYKKKMEEMWSLILGYAVRIDDMICIVL